MPGDCDERTGTQTSLRAKARVPVARCPWQIAGIPMIDDGERQPPPEPKTLVVVVTTTTNATAVTTTTTQHGSRKRHLKQSMCLCQIAHGKTSVTQETSARTPTPPQHQSQSSWPLLRLQPPYRDHYCDHDHTSWQPQKARARSYEARGPRMKVPCHQVAHGWICRLTSEDMRVTWSSPKIAPTSWNASSAFKTSMRWD